MIGADCDNTLINQYDNNQNSGRVRLMNSLYLEGKYNAQLNYWD